MGSHFDAVVVGAGPNGLAAAITIARAGRSVLVVESASEPGGSTRSAELTQPGFVHDVCAAVHAFGPLSPFLASVPLADLGVEWVRPDIPLAHPFEDRPPALVLADVPATSRVLGDEGGARYRRLVGPLVGSFDQLGPEILGPVVHRPRHPVTLARFAVPGAVPSTRLGRWLGPAAGALLAGCAAHSFLRLDRPLTSAFGLALLASGHRGGWPFVRGGSQRLAAALAAHLGSLGGELVCGQTVSSLADLPPSRVVLFDLAPHQVASIAGERLTSRFRHRLERFRAGPGAFKLDYALAAPVPWRDEDCRRAGTLHLGGSIDEIARAEAEVVAGRHPERPFVLVAQPTLFDPDRAPPGRHTLWAYCHVPNGSTVDMTTAVEDQIERFAPGFRDVVLARHVLAPADLEARNANLRGGDIAGGAHDGLQVAFRPTFGRPYRTSDASLLICSASTPPGGGVHGMCGWHAAQAALAGRLR